jgi:Protein of unknown function (DUF3659)
MKNILLILTFISSYSMVTFAQDKVPTVDSKGHIYYDKKQIGSISTTGGMDMSGLAVSRIDKNGNVVDSTGKAIGKLAKGSTFQYYMNGKDQTFSISKPDHTGMCYVKDSKGKTVLLLHNNYKQQAACAMHCANENHCLMPMMSDKEMKEHQH